MVMIDTTWWPSSPHALCPPTYDRVCVWLAAGARIAVDERFNEFNFWRRDHGLIVDPPAPAPAAPPPAPKKDAVPAKKDAAPAKK